MATSSTTPVAAHKASAWQGLWAAVISAVSIIAVNASAGTIGKDSYISAAVVLATGLLAAGRSELAIVLASHKQTKLTAFLTEVSAQVNQLADQKLAELAHAEPATYGAAVTTQSTPAQSAAAAGAI